MSPMKIFDMHIHAFRETPDPKQLLSDMEKAGIFGGCVFSNWPKRANQQLGTDFDARLEEVLGWTRGYEDRLFPVLWIHPYEENIFENIQKAADAGICAFKIICTDFYVYEPQCLAVLRKIADLRKPVIFHSGILWDGQVSSAYNRPLNWEALLDIPGLRFSMGHCSWPWIDECIALYGKFMNAGTVRSDCAEMFFDITPGTPEIYRRELLTKLYTLGYDVGNNILFGTDSTAHCYRPEWTCGWLKTDRMILDLLGVSSENRQRLYEKNLMRFLGRSETEAIHLKPTTDNANAWSCQNGQVSSVIQKWYRTLQFPKIYDEAFQLACKQIPVSDAITLSSPVYETDDGKRNLLQALYLCEQTERFYEEHRIPKEILYATLSDLVIWTNTWSGLRQELFLGELSWLKRHLSGTLFRLGRLQFCMGSAEQDIPEANTRKGDPVLEIHIPEGSAVTPAECDASIAQAKDFFARYFPNFAYRCFTCHSWMLDPTLKTLLRPDSNILAFQSRFTAVESDQDDAILRYVFAWDATRYCLKRFPCETELAKNIKKHTRDGGSFFTVLGFFRA